MKSGLATRPAAPTFGGRPVRDILFVGLVLSTAVMIGAAVALSPIIGLAAAGGLGALWLFTYGQRMIPLFHVALIAILIGYAFLGRGMAYIGVAPLFVGEMVLGLGLLAIVVSLPTARWHPVHLAIALFMAWGLIRTVPYIGTWGIDALRDGVAYGYAVFAVAVSLTVRRVHIPPLLLTVPALDPGLRPVGAGRGHRLHRVRAEPPQGPKLRCADLRVQGRRHGCPSRRHRDVHDPGPWGPHPSGPRCDDVAGLARRRRRRPAS